MTPSVPVMGRTQPNEMRKVCPGCLAMPCHKPFGLPSSLLLVQHLSGVVVLLSWS